MTEKVHVQNADGAGVMLRREDVAEFLKANPSYTEQGAPAAKAVKPVEDKAVKSAAKKSAG